MGLEGIFPQPYCWLKTQQSLKGPNKMETHLFMTFLWRSSVAIIFFHIYKINDIIIQYNYSPATILMNSWCISLKDFWVAKTSTTGIPWRSRCRYSHRACGSMVVVVVSTTWGMENVSIFFWWTENDIYIWTWWYIYSIYLKWCKHTDLIESALKQKRWYWVHIILYTDNTNPGNFHEVPGGPDWVVVLALVAWSCLHMLVEMNNNTLHFWCECKWWQWTDWYNIQYI